MPTALITLFSFFFTFFFFLQTPVLSRALDVGCAVGRSAFELARGFKEVVGIDFSSSFIAGCNHLKEHGHFSYSIQTEGQLTSECVAEVPADIVPETKKKTNKETSEEKDREL